MKFLNYLCVALVAASAALSATAAEPAGFRSTDTTLQNTFDWAREMAMKYVHTAGDPVGPWYEAALPGRDAFCMRDLSHQAVGAAILGLDAHNLNMLAKVAANISESKDWCSYWETDRLDRPAPCDYANDKEFWYNLPANFDVMRACNALYEWTADPAYVASPVFVDFYRHTAHDYADRWALGPDSIMNRRRFMNTPEPFNTKNAFHTCRGLPSYAENFSGITVAIDLVGALKTGYLAYAALAEADGNQSEADFAASRAAAYDYLIENVWWDEENNRYNTYYTQDKRFHRGEGIPYLLLVGALDRPERVSASVADVMSRQWNVENLSAFPLFLYRLGYDDTAYSILNALPRDKRGDYPEVSFGVIEGIFCGLMGIQPSASQESIATCYHGPADSESTATDVPLLGGTVTVKHVGRSSTTLTNHTPYNLTWEASFILPDGTKSTQTQTVPSGKSRTALTPTT